MGSSPPWPSHQRTTVRHVQEIGAPRAAACARRPGDHDPWNALPCLASHRSRRSVQSQLQQAQGSVPFSSRQRLRACASFTASRSKYSSQYGRSSSSGVGQKQVSTHLTRPSGRSRARAMSSSYSSPATDPAPSNPERMAPRNAEKRPVLTLAVTRYRMRYRGSL